MLANILLIEGDADNAAYVAKSLKERGHTIMSGDVSRRIPVVGACDELGGLAGILNLALACIEAFMTHVKHVTSGMAHDLRTPLWQQRQILETTLGKPRTASEYQDESAMRRAALVASHRRGARDAPEGWLGAQAS